MEKLTDICYIQYGYAFDSACFTEDCSYPPLVRIRDVKRGFSETYYSGEYPEEYVLHAGDLLVGMDGEFNIARWKSIDALLNQRVCKLTAKEGTNEEYLRFAMVKALKAIEDKTAFVTVKHLSAKELNKLELDIPCIEEQNMRAESLSKLEKIISLREEELRKLDDLIKARFVEMFGNKGENPNGYEEDTLGNLYKFQYGKGNNIPEDKGEYPCYGSNGIVGHHTEYNNEDSPIIGHIGAYAGIVNWGVGKHYVTYNGVMCKLKTDRVNPTYGFHLLQQQDFNRVATKGGGQPFVSYGDLEAPIVVVPPIEVQEAYATFANQVDKSKVAVQKALDETQLLFDSLMQEYFG